VGAGIGSAINRIQGNRVIFLRISWGQIREIPC
jgi:hypothetical protein